MRDRLGLVVLGFVAFLFSTSGCQSPKSIECNGRICAAGLVCAPGGQGCVLGEQLASCAGRAEDDACTYPGQSDGVCMGGICISAGCGNGILDSDEACDDGNREHTDGCSADCRSDESCGNGVVDSVIGESCDDSNTVSGDGCQADCVIATCGDGVLDRFEGCDEGTANSNNPDATCRSNCQPQACGDGITDSQAGENCDDGNPRPGDGCSGFCLIEECGNGVVDLRKVGNGFEPAEDCDDGDNNINHDGCQADCTSEALVWSQRSATPPGPRAFHAMAYDARRARVVLFGAGASGNDTWEWDGASWSELNPANRPAARRVHKMVYEVQRDQIVLFGGEVNGVGAVADTWLWDGVNWTQAQPANRPAARQFHAMAYDAGRGRVVLFGGQAVGLGRASDTWEWDGTNWTELQPATRPSGRIGHAMAYDPVRGRVVLFGGDIEFFGPLNDTWEWDGTNWTEAVPVNRPPARSVHELAYDAARGQLLLFGGGGFGEVDDTWTWDGNDWTEAQPTNRPPARGRHAMAYDVERSRVVLFGGNINGIGAVDDTWEWDGSNWNLPSQLTPPIRAEHAMAYDHRRGRLVLFGGANSDGQFTSFFSDTWEWDGIRWTQRTPVTSPTFRRGHAMAYDASRGRVVLFGGTTPNVHYDDTWEWDGEEWIEATPINKPAARRDHAMTFDQARGRTVLFAGRDSSSTFGDTWEWDGANWIEIVPSASPDARYHHAMSYDAIRQRSFLFGGGGNGSSGGGRGLERPAQEWDGTNWVVRAAPLLPNRGHVVAAYNPLTQTVTVTGSGAGQGGDHVANTLEWIESTSILRNQGVPTFGTGAMAFSAVQAGLVFVGHQGAAGAQNLQTWVRQYGGGTRESCTTGLDGDGDGLVGCEDPDCWGRCAPECPPGHSCDMGAPRCGDAVCNDNLETPRLCPADCGAPLAVCGDNLCDASESSLACPGDC